MQANSHLVLAIASVALLGYVSGCTNQKPTALLSSSTPKTTETVTIKENNKSITKLATPEPQTSDKNPVASGSKKGIYLGDIKEISNDICGNSKITYAYGETPSYQVYVCADEKAPDRPRYYISRNKDGSGGLNLEAIDYNPQKDNFIEFNNSGYLYILEAPTAQNPEPAMRVSFPNGKLSEEPLLRYLDRNKVAKTSSSAKPLEYVLQNRQALGVCQDEFRDDDATKGMGSKAFKISDQKYIVQIQCFLAAYQGAFEYVLWIDESPQPRVIPLQFDTFQEPKSGEKPQKLTTRAIAGLPRVNVRSQTISNFTKFRGLGDCGSSSVYKLEGERLVLKEYRAKYTCDGEYVQDLPLIYP